MLEALVIIDVQRDYFPGGRMEVVNSEKAAQMAKSLLGTFRKKNKVIVHVQHISTREGSTFFLPGTNGAEIHESVFPLEGEKIITKHFPNSFRDTELEKFLHENGVKKIIFCGMMSHMCIDATVRAAFDNGFNCIVAHNACATRNLQFQGREIDSDQVHGAFMAALGAVYAQVITTEECVQLLK